MFDYFWIYSTKTKTRKMHSFYVLVVLCAVKYALSEDTKTTDLQMNSEVNRELYKKIIKLETRIDDFLNIICPQYSDKQGEDVEIFTLYAVHDKELYDTCNIKDKDDENQLSGKVLPILQCDSPFMPKKLTLKFQKLSPYPMGFTFKEGQTYYYLGFPKNHHLKKSHRSHPCTDVIRLEIKVNPGESNLVIPDVNTVYKEATTPTTSTTTTTLKTTTRLRTLTTKKSVIRLPSQGQQTDGDGNGASQIHYVTMMASLLALLTLYINM